MTGWFIERSGRECRAAVVLHCEGGYRGNTMSVCSAARQGSASTRPLRKASWRPGVNHLLRCRSECGGNSSLPPPAFSQLAELLRDRNGVATNLCGPQPHRRRKARSAARHCRWDLRRRARRGVRLKWAHRVRGAKFQLPTRLLPLLAREYRLAAPMPGRHLRRRPIHGHPQEMVSPSAGFGGAQ